MKHFHFSFFIFQFLKRIAGSGQQLAIGRLLHCGRRPCLLWSQAGLFATGYRLPAIGFLLLFFIASCSKDDNTGNDNWVDLGLPSGTLWATCNLGADTPEDYGDYFAWGETNTKDLYDWSTYRYCTAEGDSLLTLTKYNTSEAYGTVDGLTSLQTMDDAAIVPAYTVLTAGNLCGFDDIEVPEGGIALDSQSYMNQSTTWQNLAGSFHIATPGNYLLVFLWHNNLGGYYQTPAAVDNINIMLGGGTLPPPSHIVTVSVNNAEYGTVTGGGLYNHGDTATLMALPYEDCFFTQWNDGDTDNPRTLIVTGDTVLMASFRQAESVDVVHLDDCTIYPNPTSGKVTVVTAAHLVLALLTDMLGHCEEMALTAIGASCYTLDITSCRNAVYLLTVIAADGSRHTVRLLKK